MIPRYRAGMALTSLALLGAFGATPSPRASCIPATALYSHRALHRHRMQLQVEIIEAHRARLALVRAAITGGVPVERLLELPDDATAIARLDPRRVPWACWAEHSYRASPSVRPKDSIKEDRADLKQPLL